MEVAGCPGPKQRLVPGVQRVKALVGGNARTPREPGRRVGIQGDEADGEKANGGEETQTTLTRLARLATLSQIWERVGGLPPG